MDHPHECYLAPQSVLQHPSLQHLSNGVLINTPFFTVYSRTETVYRCIAGKDEERTSGVSCVPIVCGPQRLSCK